MLKRSNKNPIIKAENVDLSSVGVRVTDVYNPASALTEEVVLLLRVKGEDDISRLVVARSKNGEDIDYIDNRTVLSPQEPQEKLGVEDARISQMKTRDLEGMTNTNGYETTHLITYVGYMDKTDGFNTRIGLTYTNDFKDIIRLPFPKFPKEFINAKNGVLFPERVNGKFAMLYRPKVEPLSIRLAYSDNLLDWDDAGEVIRPFADWCSARVGAAAPPILIEDREMSGWLTSFHGADRKNRYSIGFGIMDYDNPKKIKSITVKPVLEPEEPYEKYGQIPNVVFLTGLLRMDNELLAHWGCGDSCISAGHYNLPELMAHMKRPENIEAARLQRVSH